MGTVLQNKSQDNLDIAKECLSRKKYLDIAVSRMYYSIFQKIKSCIINDNNFFQQYKKNPIRQPLRKNDFFEHGVIAKLIIRYLESKKNPSYNIEKGKKISIDIGYMLQKRKDADYDENIRFYDCNKINNLILLTEDIIDFIDKNNI